GNFISFGKFFNSSFDCFKSFIVGNQCRCLLYCSTFCRACFISLSKLLNCVLFDCCSNLISAYKLSCFFNLRSVTASSSRFCNSLLSNAGRIPFLNKELQNLDELSCFFNLRSVTTSSSRFCNSLLSNAGRIPFLNKELQSLDELSCFFNLRSVTASSSRFCNSLLSNGILPAFLKILPVSRSIFLSAISI